MNRIITVATLLIAAIIAAVYLPGTYVLDEEALAMIKKYFQLP